MSSPAQQIQHEPQRETSRYRRAVDIAREINAKQPEAVFDAFWRDGELALLFGAAGSYKSLLAVQVGDAIARGREPLEVRNAECGVRNAGKRSEARPRRRKVLYVDLVLSDRQFSARYGRYKFSANLYRDRPTAGEDIASWVRASILNDGFTAVIIDDLSMVSRTNDGTRETLGLMRELRQITVETGVPILVLADSFPSAWERDVSERDLRRSRVLCGIADSVFAIASTTPETRVIVQTRSRSGELVWTHSRPLWGELKTLENGLLGLELTEDVEDVGLSGDDRIREVKRLHDEEEKTFRQIASELGISKSTAQRLYSEWHPGLVESFEERHERWLDERDRMLSAKLKSLGIEEDDDDDMIDESESAEDAAYLREIGIESGESCESGVSESAESRVSESGVSESGVSESTESGVSEFGDSLELDSLDSQDSLDSLDSQDSQDSLDSPDSQDSPTRQITDLDQSYDDYGNEIFVEEWGPDPNGCGPTSTLAAAPRRQKPSVWYKRTRQGFSRHTRTTLGVNVSNVEEGMEFC
jgi:hypothetical protein